MRIRGEDSITTISNRIRQSVQDSWDSDPVIESRPALVLTTALRRTAGSLSAPDASLVASLTQWLPVVSLSHLTHPGLTPVTSSPVGVQEDIDSPPASSAEATCCALPLGAQPATHQDCNFQNKPRNSPITVLTLTHNQGNQDILVAAVGRPTPPQAFLQASIVSVTLTSS